MACQARFNTSRSQFSAPEPYRKRVISPGLASSLAMSASEAARTLPIILATRSVPARRRVFRLTAQTLQQSRLQELVGFGHRYALAADGPGADVGRAGAARGAHSRGANDGRRAVLHPVRPQRAAARRLDLARTATAGATAGQGDAA